MRQDYTITTNPSGQLYFDLLKWCASHADRVGFTVSIGRELSARATALLRSCEARGAERREVTEWPGTIMHSGKALMYSMAARPNLDVILGATSDLFSWQEPDLPEDLFFLRIDGSSLLSSIAHEADAYLSLETDELSDLRESLPAIVEVLEPPSIDRRIPR